MVLLVRNNGKVIFRRELSDLEVRSIMGYMQVDYMSLVKLAFKQYLGMDSLYLVYEDTCEYGYYINIWERDIWRIRDIKINELIN